MSSAATPAWLSRRAASMIAPERSATCRLTSRAVGVHGLLAHALERGHRRERRRPVRERDLHAQATDARLELVRRALGDHVAVVDDRDPVGEPVGLLEVLGRQQDGRAVADELLDRLPQVDPRARVQAGGRLVEEQHRRARDERRREVQPAPHAARVGLRRAARRRRRARSARAAPARAASPPRACCRRAGRPSSGSRSPVRFSSTAAYWPASPIRERSFARVLDHVQPGHARLARVGRQQRREHAHRGRLPGPVRAEHAQHGAGRGLEIDTVEGADVPERLDEALGADGRLFDISCRNRSRAFRPGSVRNRRRLVLAAPQRCCGHELSATSGILGGVSETTSSRLLTLLSLLAGPPRLAGPRAGRPAGGLRRARSAATSSGCARSATRSSR